MDMEAGVRPSEHAGGLVRIEQLQSHEQPEHGAAERRGGRERKHYLMRKCRLAGTPRSGDQVERELRQTTAKHFVQARNAGG